MSSADFPSPQCNCQKCRLKRRAAIDPTLTRTRDEWNGPPVWKVFTVLAAIGLSFVGPIFAILMILRTVPGCDPKEAIPLVGMCGFVLLYVAGACMQWVTSGGAHIWLWKNKAEQERSAKQEKFFPGSNWYKGWQDVV